MWAITHISLQNLAFVLVSANGASKAFAHTVAYNFGWKSGLLYRKNGFHRNAADVCNQDNMKGMDGTHCVQGYIDAFNIKQTAYWQGYEMGLQDLKNRIHQQNGHGSHLY